jgi:hypothetical protein
MTIILDTTVSSHIIQSRDAFWTYTPNNTRLETSSGIIEIKGHGLCKVRVSSGPHTATLELRHCFHGPLAKSNLLSVGTMVNHSFRFTFGQRAQIHFPAIQKDKNRLPTFRYFEAITLGGFFFVEAQFLKPISSTIAAVTPTVCVRSPPTTVCTTAPSCKRIL